MINYIPTGIARTNNSSTSDVEAGKYAPILKFPKYIGAGFNPNSRFIIRLLEFKSSIIRTSEIYITTGESYNTSSASAPIVNCINLIPSEVKYIMNEFEDYYILYVKSSISGCYISAQVLFCENISFVEPYNFESFTVEPNSFDNIIEPINGYFTLTPRGIRRTGASKGYYKIATLSARWANQGCTYAFSICGLPNGDTNAIIGGTVYIKARRTDSDYLMMTIKSGGTTENFTNDRINIIAVPVSENEVEIYIHLLKDWNAVQIKDDFWNYDGSDTFVRVFEPIFYETIPTDNQTTLF